MTDDELSAIARRAKGEVKDYHYTPGDACRDIELLLAEVARLNEEIDTFGVHEYQRGYGQGIWDEQRKAARAAVQVNPTSMSPGLIGEVDSAGAEMLSVEDVRAEQRLLASRLGLSVDDAYRRIDEQGSCPTITETKLHMIRFLLGEDK